MARNTLMLFVTLAAVVVIGMPAVQAAEQTIEGEIVDSKCFLSMDLRGAKHQECATKCSKSGIPAGIVDAKGNYYTIAFMSPAVADIQASTARITGEVRSGSIIPKKVEIQKNGKWEEFKLPETMM